MSNAKHGYGDPNGDFNAHIDIVGSMFGGSLILTESRVVFDHLVTTAGMTLSEPAAAARDPA